MTLNEVLRNSVPAVDRFTVLVAGVPRPVSSASVNPSAKTVTLQLASPVTNGQTVTLAYVDPTGDQTSGVVEDGAGNDLASFAAQPVTNATPPPVLATASTTLNPTQRELTLLGNKRLNAVGNGLDNIIIGNSNNNRIFGLDGKDLLTGGGTIDADTFGYNSLGESVLAGFDVITDFNQNDRILAPFGVETERLTASKGVVGKRFFATDIAEVLTTSTFGANAVAAFTVTGQPGSFVAMNDDRAGFQADTDAILHLQNYNVNSANFVDFV